jgi:hypothetical protein
MGFFDDLGGDIGRGLTDAGKWTQHATEDTFSWGAGLLGSGTGKALGGLMDSLGGSNTILIIGVGLIALYIVK